MEPINDGGPAFPVPQARMQMGMTLRDWFAGQALSQSVADYGEPDVNSSAKQRRDRGNPVLPYATREMSRESIIAYQAYRYADAMLAARAAK